MRKQSGVLFDPGLVPRFLELLPDVVAIQGQYASTPVK